MSLDDDARLLDSVSVALDGVERALERLEDGSYGFCEICGARMAPTLLERDPLISRCQPHC